MSIETNNASPEAPTQILPIPQEAARTISEYASDSLIDLYRSLQQGSTPVVIVTPDHLHSGLSNGVSIQIGRLDRDNPIILQHRSQRDVPEETMASTPFTHTAIGLRFLPGSFRFGTMVGATYKQGAYTERIASDPSLLFLRMHGKPTEKPTQSSLIPSSQFYRELSEPAILYSDAATDFLARYYETIIHDQTYSMTNQPAAILAAGVVLGLPLEKIAGNKEIADRVLLSAFRHDLTSGVHHYITELIEATRRPYSGSTPSPSLVPRPATANADVLRYISSLEKKSTPGNALGDAALSATVASLHPQIIRAAQEAIISSAELLHPFVSAETHGGTAISRSHTLSIPVALRAACELVDEWYGLTLASDEIDAATTPNGQSLTAHITALQEQRTASWHAYHAALPYTQGPWNIPSDS